MASVRTFPLAFVFVLILAAPALAAPTAGAPRPLDPPVLQGVAETFQSNSSTSADGETIVAAVWDFGDGSAPVTDDTIGDGGVSTVRHQYAQPGSYTITVLVTSSTGETSTASSVVEVAPNAPPIASFTSTPDPGVAGQEMFFESTSTDPEGRGTQGHLWDFNNDGRFDARGRRQAFTFTTPGTKQVRLSVEDEDGYRSEVVQPVNVVAPPPGNALPVARFSVSDTNPVVGQQVSFESFSYDSDGSIVSQTWDLDGDGDFDENVDGRNAFATFSSPGQKNVRLQVRDSSGGVQTETREITVRALSLSKRLAFLTPFPVVRYTGSYYPAGARLDLLEVKGPPRVRINVRCSGRDCPVKHVKKRKPRGKPARIRAFKDFMRKGTNIVVRVRKGNLIGKFTRITIRGGKPPKAKHLCLMPKRQKGTRCPRGRPGS